MARQVAASPRAFKAVLSAKFTRTVAADHTVRFEGQTYQLRPPGSCPSLVKSLIEVQQWFDGSIHFRHARLKKGKPPLVCVVSPQTFALCQETRSAYHRPGQGWQRGLLPGKRSNGTCNTITDGQPRHQHRGKRGSPL
jgi:hypothetical protein